MNNIKGSSDSKTFLKTHISGFLCYFIPFFILVSSFIYCFYTNKFREVYGYYMIHYLYTYSHGFVARGFVGQVLSLFFENVNDEVIKNVVILFSFLLIFSSALCIGKALNKVKEEKECFFYISFIIVILFLFQGSFRTYMLDIKLDKILWALTLFAVFVSDRKYAVWLVPVLCIIATLINPVFLFCSMILISIILLQNFYSSGFSIKNGIICAISYISMIFIGVYGAISEKWLGFETPRELVDYFFSRYSGSTTNIDYFHFENEWLFDYFEPLKNVFRMAFDIYFKEWGNAQKCILNFLIVALPIYILLGIIWLNSINAESNKFQKFIYFLCMISPVVLIPPISISWEASKYFSNNFIVQLCLIVFFVVRKDESVISSLRKLVSFCKNRPLLSCLMLLYFAMIII